MKVDSIAVDLGFDMRLKLILSRAEQLVKQETTALVESKSLTYSLQRKVGYTNNQWWYYWHLEGNYCLFYCI